MDLDFSEEVELKFQFDRAPISAGVANSQAASSILKSCGFADKQTCERIVASRESLRTGNDKQEWTFIRLYEAAKQCKSVQSANSYPPLFYGVPGGLKHFGALNEHYEGTVSAREKVLYGGIVTALATRTLLSPLERIKTYMMITPYSAESYANSYNSIGSTYRLLRNSESFRSLWRGNFAHMCEGFSRMSVYGLGYFYLHRQAASSEGAQLSYRSALVHGGVTALAAELLAYPFQVLRSRMHVHDVHKFPSLTQSLVRMSILEGYSGLYRAFGISLLGTAAYMALDTLWHRQFQSLPASSFNFASSTSASSSSSSGSSSFLSSSSESSSSLSVGQQRQLDRVTQQPMFLQPSPYVTAAAASAGVLAIQTLIYPLNVVRRRLQVIDRASPQLYSGALDCFEKTLAKEGARGLFRGYSAHALGSVLAFNLAYLQFSYLSDFFDDQNRIIDMYFRTYDKK